MPGEHEQRDHLAHRDEAQRAKGDEEESAGSRGRKLENSKAGVRAGDEHPSHVLKKQFEHHRTRYRELAKNTAQLHALFIFAGLAPAGRTIESAHARTS